MILLNFQPTAAPDACGCENGGTCVSVTRRGRVFNTCRCPPGYGGRICDIGMSLSSIIVVYMYVNCNSYIFFLQCFKVTLGGTDNTHKL